MKRINNWFHLLINSTNVRRISRYLFKDENESLVKMKVQFDSQIPPMIQLDLWRKIHYEDINREYEDKVKALKSVLSIEDQEISKTITIVDELIKEGDASIEQINDLRQTIDSLTERVNQLNDSTSIPVNNQIDLLNKTIQMGNSNYIIRGKMLCNNIYLYALESEKGLLGYDGICPMCSQKHIQLPSNRGFYVEASLLDAEVRRK